MAPRLSGWAWSFEDFWRRVSISVIDRGASGVVGLVSLDTPFCPTATTTAPPVSAESARVEAFVREHHSFVWRVLRRCGLAPADADDAAQQVFLTAAARLDTVARVSERAFLYRIAARVASNAHRTVRRRRETAGLEDGDPSASPPAPDDLLDQRRARELLDRVLGELPEDLCAVFVLFEIEGLRSPEIAEALAIPVGTVASRLRRARAEVEERVARYRSRPLAKGSLP
jgi:RNA polymerase sigma-70 factor, ECF subfamily